MPGQLIQVAEGSNDMKRRRGENVCHNYRVASKEKYRPKPNQTLFADHSYKRVYLPSQSAVEPVLELSTHGQRSTANRSVVQGKEPAAMI